MGSSPTIRTSYVGGASWTGTGLQTHGNEFDSHHLLHISVDFLRKLMYNNVSAVVMELVYVSDLKSEFCGFESHQPHQVLSH